MAYLEELLPEFRKGAKIRRRCWKPERFLFIKDGLIFDYEDCVYTSYATSILEDDWELYEEPIEWDYIIKNKCLCWFWDDKDFVIAGTLDKLSESVNQLKDFKYKEKKTSKYWRHCRPIQRNEVTFYDSRCR